MRTKTAPVFAELASILRKTSGVADVLAGALAPLAAQIELAFIYGSIQAAQGRETADSDIDVMLVGSLGFDDAVRLLWPLQSELGREINPQVFSRDAFATRAQRALSARRTGQTQDFLMGRG